MSIVTIRTGCRVTSPAIKPAQNVLLGFEEKDHDLAADATLTACVGIGSRSDPAALPTISDWPFFTGMVTDYLLHGNACISAIPDSLDAL
jgi:hypothetical protein